MTDYTERDVLAALFTRFDPPEYMGLTQVRNGDENGIRLIDFLAVGMYPSQGNPIHAVEVKVDRTDWLNEIETPGKHAYFEDIADYFWVATAPDVVRGEHEIPEGWGWLKMHGDILHRKVGAKKRGSSLNNKAFLAALLRQAQMQRNDPAKGQVTAAYRRGVRSGRQEAKQKYSTEQWKFESDQSDIKKIKQAFNKHGVPLSGYNAESVARQLAPIWSELRKANGLAKKLESVRDDAQRVVDLISEALEDGYS